MGHSAQSPTQWTIPVSKGRGRSVGRSGPGHLTWLAGAALLGFGVPAVFSGVLELSRGLFVAVYLVFAGPFLAG